MNRVSYALSSGAVKILSPRWPASVMASGTPTMRTDYQPTHNYSFQSRLFLHTERYEPSTRIKIEIRPATPADYDAVVSLTGEEDVHDYLPSLYTHLCSDPDNYPFVATSSDTVVGFGMARVFDGNLTGLGRALRVRKDFRDSGIFKRLIYHLQTVSDELFPQKRYETYASMADEASISSYLHKGGFKPVLRKATMNFYHSASSRAHTETKGDNQRDQIDIEIRELTRSDLSRLIQAQDVCRELIPHDRIINWHTGYRLMEENVRHLVTDIGGAFASFQDLRGSPPIKFHKYLTPRAHDSSGSCTSIVKDETHLDADTISRVAMLSFYTCYSTRYGALCCLDLYSRDWLSRDHFRAHLQQSLEILQRRFPDKKSVLALTFDPSVSRDFVTSCLAEHGIIKPVSHQGEWMTLYEKPLKPN